MKTHLLVTCCLFSAVCVEVSAVLQVSGEEGGHVKIRCTMDGPFLSFKNNEKYFCRDPCSSSEDILVITSHGQSQNYANRGRYEINDPRDGYVFNVTISQLMQSDSGRYQCGINTKSALLQMVNLIVRTATPPPSPVRPTTTPTNLRTPTSILTTASPDLPETPLTNQDLENTSSDWGMQVVYAIVGLVVTVTMLALALLVFYRKWKEGNRKSPEISDHQAIDNRASRQGDIPHVYDEISEKVGQTDCHPASGESCSASIINDLYDSNTFTKEPGSSAVVFPKDPIHPSSSTAGSSLNDSATVIYSTVTGGDSRTLPATSNCDT